MTLTANQDIMFTTTVLEGALVGPNNVMVLEVNASVYWDNSTSSTAAIVIVFPRSSFSTDLDSSNYEMQQSEATTTNCLSYHDCFYCHFNGRTTESPGSCTKEISCEPCECPSPPTWAACTEVTCHECPVYTQCPFPGTQTWYPCPAFTCVYSTPAPVICPTPPSPKDAPPAFSKTIYETSLASWPTAGTTVHLGISAKTPANDPVVYALIDPPQFVTLAANQDIIFTTNVAKGAFVGPNNVMVLEINPTSYWETTLSGSAAIVIVFPH